MEKEILQLLDLQLGPFSVLSLAHAIKVAWDIRTSGNVHNAPILQLMFITFVCAVGGTSTTAVILGKPFGWLGGNSTILTYTLIPILVYRSPADIVFNLLQTLKPLLYPIIVILDSVSNALSIVHAGVDGVRLHRDGAIRSSIGAAIICGTLSGSGGGIWASAFNLGSISWSLQVPVQLRSRAWGLYNSFVTALFYLFYSELWGLVGLAVSSRESEILATVTFHTTLGFLIYAMQEIAKQQRVPKEPSFSKKPEAKPVETPEKGKKLRSRQKQE